MVQRRVGIQPKGFTIIELLVVIVVIGILATITVVSYTGIQKKAVVASLISDLNNVSKQLSMYQVLNGAYPDTLSLLNLTASQGTVYDSYYPTSTGFCVTARKNSISYRITNTGLSEPGVCLDSQLDTLSLIKWDTWVEGAGTVTGYPFNGDGSSIITDTNPFGQQDIIWDVSNQDVASNDDGGWITPAITAITTNKYRFSVYARRKVIGNGTTFFGTMGYPATNLGYLLNRSNGSVNNNPYFSARTWWGNANQWYLLVGYIWPAGSGTGAAMADSGIYTMDGTKILSNSDYVFQSTTTSFNFRSTMYYSTDITTNQQWYKPRIDVVGENVPTINELLQR